MSATRNSPSTKRVNCSAVPYVEPVRAKSMRPNSFLSRPIKAPSSPARRGEDALEEREQARHGKGHALGPVLPWLNLAKSVSAEGGSPLGPKSEASTPAAPVMVAAGKPVTTALVPAIRAPGASR